MSINNKTKNKNEELLNATDLNIELSEEIAEGTYSNLTIITHSHSEFIMDFINVMPNSPKSKVKARIILTPNNMKRVLRAIQDNIKKYEDINGTIPEIQEIEVPLNFGTPTAQA